LKAEDVMLLAKSRLRDNTNLNWDENELLDLLNMAYIEVCKELQIYKKEIIYSSDGVETFYPIPKDMFNLITIYVDDLPIKIKSFDWIVNNQYKLSSEIIGYLNYDGIRLSYPPKEDAKIRIFYNYTKSIYSSSDELERSEERRVGKECPM
jgi:hypothetical protein